MKIAIVVDDYHGGAGNIAQLLALELKQSNDVFLLLTNPHSNSRYDLKNIYIKEENFSIQTKNKVKGLIYCVRKMKKTLADFSPDLIISFLDNNNSLVCLSQLKTKTPIIVSERSNPLKIYPKFPWNHIRRIAYRRANVVTVQFDIFKNFDKARFAKKCKVTSNIVDKPAYLKTNWKNDIIRFVTFGRLEDIKRMDLMIKLFARAQAQLKNVELHIYGEGKNQEKLRALITELNIEKHVFLEGYCNEVHKTLTNGDIYLMTSEQEGFPNGLSEAMAVGLPSVSIRCHEGIAELAQNEQAGFTVAEGNETKFVEKMLELAKDAELRKSMGQRAQSISDIYSKKHAMEQWYACIEETLKNEKNIVFYR